MYRYNFILFLGFLNKKGGNMNGHIYVLSYARGERRYKRIHGGYCFKGKNEAGERVLHFIL